MGDLMATGRRGEKEAEGGGGGFHGGTGGWGGRGWKGEGLRQAAAGNVSTLATRHGMCESAGLTLGIVNC